MAVGSHPDGIASKAKAGDEVAHFVDGEGRAERIGEELPLVGRRVGGVVVTDLLQLRFVVGSAQVAVE